MPVKNAGPYLGECLDSILAQDYTDWELIAVDDHSSDDSYSILNEYAQDDKRIHVFQLNKVQKGIIPALQWAYENCSGEYITRMDADDLMSVSKLSLMVSNLNRQGYGNVAVGLVSYFSNDGVGEGYRRYAEWLNDLTSASSNFNEIYKECVIPSPCWMMARGDFDAIGGFQNDTYPEDYDLCFRMRKHQLNIIGIKDVLHHWRDHSNRASRNDPNYKDNRFLELKMSYFLTEDLNPKRKLILWGAGRKGKEIAKKLVDNAISFIWFTNNPKKIGHNIYGIVLRSDEDITDVSAPQVICAIAMPDERRKAINKIESLGLQLEVDYFAFC